MAIKIRPQAILTRMAKCMVIDILSRSYFILFWREKPTYKKKYVLARIKIMMKSSTLTYLDLQK